MKSYNTLRGAISGNESEGFEPYFTFSAHLRIYSESGLDFEEINATLKVEPTSTKQRGVPPSSGAPPSKFDFWRYTAPIAKEADPECHIDALWHIVKSHAEFLKRLKEHAKIDVYLVYASNIDHAGFRLPHRAFEMFVALGLDLEVGVVVVPDT